MTAIESKGDEAGAAEIAKEESKVMNNDVGISSHEVKCSACNVQTIQGARYCCLTCQNFNLCSNCEENTDHPHALLKIRRPG